ncbi:MAG: hypothetical protein HYY37_01290 [Candidatus Aenigmarchaeota archaeon]|nr:hypothetical protein [Candidatus Aenigmarchaeota archaeon]
MKNLSLLVAILVFASGCVTSTQPSTVNQANTSFIADANKQKALESINNAKLLHSTLKNYISNFEIQVSEANFRGVNLTGTTGNVISIKNQLDDNLNLINKAENAYGIGSYSTSINNSEQAIDKFQFLKQKLQNLTEILQHDYQRTMEKYAKLIEDSELSYMEAEAFIVTVEDFGINVYQPKLMLMSLNNSLNAAKRFFKENQFSSINLQPDRIKAEADSIKNDVTDLYFDSAITEKLKDAEKYIETNEAKEILAEADSKRREKRHSESVDLINC